MSSFMRGLEALSDARARLDKRRAQLSPRLLVDDDDLGRAFRAGDIVRDTVTGGRGRAERIEVRRVILPLTRR